MKTPDLLLVDDDPGMIQVMARALSGLGRLRFATGGEQALRQMADATPDLVLLDGDMPGLNGLEVCRRMKGDPQLAGVPVIFVTGQNSAEDELRGLETGASDFIAKPISEPLLVARARTQLRVKALTDELRAMASTDGLTGVANRRSFDEALAREWRRQQRSGQPLSLLLVDVDHFKAYNDHYGHQGGDACLRSVAQALAEARRRPADLAARYGGEEFALLLPDTDRDGADYVARRIMELIEALALPHESSRTAPHVTVSVGISYLDQIHADRRPAGAGPATPGESPEALLRAADIALYAAKQAGRARACCLDLLDVDSPQRVRAARHHGRSTRPADLDEPA